MFNVNVGLMAEEQNINPFTASDIERYHKGLMSPKERNALEKAALDDPLLADALEGYSQFTGPMDKHLADLRKRLENRTKKTRVDPVLTGRESFSWWKVAAMIIVVIGAGLLVYQIAFNKKQTGLAQDKSNAPINAAANDSVNVSDPSTISADSNNKIDTLSLRLVSKGKQKSQRTPGSIKGKVKLRSLTRKKIQMLMEPMM
jgi:hypothetical protein